MSTESTTRHRTSAAGKGVAGMSPFADRVRRWFVRRNWFLLWLIPLVGFIVTWAILPIVSSLGLSFTNYRMGQRLTEVDWVGLYNYRLALRDPKFGIALKNSIIYAALGVPVKNLLALLIAQLLFSLRRAKGFFRTCAFLPVVTPPLATIILFSYLYQHQYGLFNQALLWLGLGRVRWLTSATMVKPSIVGMTVWNSVGYPTIVLLAGLGTIPESLREAARIDGANSWQVFWRITWPLLRHSLAYVFITNAIGWLQIFGTPNIMTQGGPFNSSLSAVMHIRNIGLTQYRGGVASAFAFVLFSIILVMTLTQLRFFRTEWEY